MTSAVDNSMVDTISSARLEIEPAPVDSQPTETRTDGNKLGRAAVLGDDLPLQHTQPPHLRRHRAALIKADTLARSVGSLVGGVLSGTGSGVMARNESGDILIGGALLTIGGLTALITAVIAALKIGSTRTRNGRDLRMISGSSAASTFGGFAVGYGVVQLGRFTYEFGKDNESSKALKKGVGGFLIPMGCVLFVAGIFLMELKRRELESRQEAPVGEAWELVEGLPQPGQAPYPQLDAPPPQGQPGDHVEEHDRMPSAQP